MKAELSNDFLIFQRTNCYGHDEYYWAIFGLQSKGFFDKEECWQHAISYLMESHVNLMRRVSLLEQRSNITGHE